MPQAASPPPRRRLPSRPLNREKIAAAALDLTREARGSRMSMRNLASTIGVDVAALYHHYESKDDLLAAVARLASEDVALPAADEGTWQERVVELARGIRQCLVCHPELSFFGGGSPGATPFLARANAALARVLFGAGLRGTELLFATQTILHQVTAIAESEVLRAAASSQDDRRFAESIALLLPAEVQQAWPKPRKRASIQSEFDEFFDFAMQALLGGIRPRSGTRRGKPPR